MLAAYWSVARVLSGVIRVRTVGTQGTCALYIYKIMKNDLPVFQIFFRRAGRGFVSQRRQFSLNFKMSSFHRSETGICLKRLEFFLTHSKL